MLHVLLTILLLCQPESVLRFPIAKRRAFTGHGNSLQCVQLLGHVNGKRPRAFQIDGFH